MTMRDATSQRVGEMPSPQHGKRRGVPLTVYFSEALSQALSAAAEERRVGKSTIVRIAVERLLQHLDSGQLNLPLGL